MTLKDIPETLDHLCNLYDENSKDEQMVYYFSKLAVLELSGWVESMIDQAIKEHFTKCSQETQNDAEKIINKCYGFKYKENIRPLLSNTLGIKNLSVIEEKLSKNGDLDIITNTFGQLAKMRDILAHTYVASHQSTIDSPLETRAKYKRIENPVSNLSRQIKDL